MPRGFKYIFFSDISSYRSYYFNHLIIFQLPSSFEFLKFDTFPPLTFVHRNLCSKRLFVGNVCCGGLAFSFDILNFAFFWGRNHIPEEKCRKIQVSQNFRRWICLRFTNSLFWFWKAVLCQTIFLSEDTLGKHRLLLNFKLGKGREGAGVMFVMMITIIIILLI